MKLTVYNMDVMRALAEIPDESVDCIITSPPYWGLRDYGVEGQLGLEADWKDYLKRMLNVTAELQRVLKKTGTLWWNHGDTYSGSGQGAQTGFADSKRQKVSGSMKESITQDTGITAKCKMMFPERLALKMIDEQDWICRNDCIWWKPNHMPSSVKDRLSNSWEHIYFFTKSKNYYFNLDAIRISNEVVGVTDMRPPGILRQKLYPGSVYNQSTDPHLAQFKSNSFNIRVRDAQRGRIKEKWGRLASASQVEISAYDEKNYWKNQKEVYQRNNPHTLRTKEGYIALNPNHPGDLSHPNGKNPGDVWRITTKPYREAHFATFPPDLPERCIKAGCPPGGVVLDPFAGSGTTLKMAIEQRCSAIGIEINSRYIKLLEKRTQAKGNLLFDYELKTQCPEKPLNI